MSQDEAWEQINNDVVAFIKTNKRNPSKHIDEERGRYLNWLKHNRKLYAAGGMREDRLEMFRELMELSEKYKRLNQYC